MKIEDLNETCPFGDRSTNYLSKQGRAPHLRDAQIANKLISSTLGLFVKFLDQNPKAYSTISIERYDEWGEKSSRISKTAPQSIENVVPIRLARSAEIAIDEIRSSNFKAIRIIIQLHDEVFKEECSHMKASRRVMAFLKDNYIRIFGDDLLAEIITIEECSLGEGLLIPDDLWHAAVSYQDLQERVDSVEEVKRFNEFIASRKDILSNILGIQVRLCEMIELFLNENPNFKGGRIAFSEVALWDERTGEMTPSSRFLKILIHNWGMYFLERPNSSCDVMLRHAVCRALEDEIYKQDIFIFRRFEDKIRLHGVVSKVCPARLAVGKMILHYLSE